MKYLLHAFILLLLIASSACAYNINVYSRNNVKDQVSEVLINSEVIMRLYDTIDNQDPLARAEQIAQRITQLVSVGLDPKEIKVHYVNGYYRGMIGNRQLFTVGKKEASVNQTTEDNLAIEWIEKLRAMLKNMPVSNVQPEESDATVAQLSTPSSETGTASWFSAGGDDFIAVHPSLPVGSQVRVKNVTNGWSIVVKIIGNKILPPGRIINVSEAAARALGIKQAGSGKVLLSPAVY